MDEILLPAYRVTVSAGALASVGDIARDAAPAHRFAVITDDTVRGLYAARVADAIGSSAVTIFSVPAGEVHKTRESWARITDEMLAAGFGRDTTVVAVGGGVVGDLAGFVAATFMRGVPVVQVPTTLLAMIDASIGGKTGVDTPAGKNLVGAFHQPAAVVIDPAVLSTLPPEHLRAGLAEALKHGAIADESYFDDVARLGAALPALLRGRAVELPGALTPLIATSVRIKAGVVGRDEREGGFRKILNFGHTIGHAVETASGYALLHGEAVAIGMALESELAERANVAERGTAERIRSALEVTGLPVDRPRQIDVEVILRATRADKKARAGAVEFALPTRVGTMASGDGTWAVRVPDDLIRAVLA